MEDLSGLRPVKFVRGNYEDIMQILQKEEDSATSAESSLHEEKDDSSKSE